MGVNLQWLAHMLTSPSPLRDAALKRGLRSVSAQFIGTHTRTKQWWGFLVEVISTRSHLIPGAVCLRWKHSLTRRLEHAALMCAAWQPLPKDLPVKRGASAELCAANSFFFFLGLRFLQLMRQCFVVEQKQKQQKKITGQTAVQRLWRGDVLILAARFTVNEWWAKLTHNLWSRSCRHDTVPQCKV